MTHTVVVYILIPGVGMVMIVVGSIVLLASKKVGPLQWLAAIAIWLGIIVLAINEFLLHFPR